MNFKAAVLVKKNYIKILDLKKPELNKAQLFVKIIYSSLCHTQLSEIKGIRGEDKFLPHCLGHEGVGVIIDKHKTVKKFRINDYVCLSWIKSKGKDAGGVIYRDTRNRIINGGPVHTLNEFAVVSENRLYKLKDSKNLKSKVLLGCALSTAYSALKNKELNKLKSICVIGCGGLGLATILVAKKLGYKDIIAVDKVKSKLIAAKKLGANYFFKSTDSLKKFVNLDVVVECTGNINVLKNSISYPKKFGGKFVFIGNYPHKSKIDLDPLLIVQGITFMGAWNNLKPFDDMFKKLENIIKEKNLKIFFGNKIYSLRNINKALKDFENGKVIRPLIKF